MVWDELILLKNIFTTWQDFSAGKIHKHDVVEFKMNLEEELLGIHFDLKNNCYQHSSYQTFKVYDPKERIIRKATVRDRVVHRLLYNYALPIFNRQWLSCSFSCRPGFGQHLSIKKVKKAIEIVTGNYSKRYFAVKCDIQKFFDNIDHQILFSLICREIYESHLRDLFFKVIDSYYLRQKGTGLPIGNLTSQIFANIYLHELDLFAKHILKLRYYYRYADDFIFLVPDEKTGQEFVIKFGDFLINKLKLNLHPRKVIIRQTDWGVDWLGKILLPGYILLRSSTKKRMMKNIKNGVIANFDQRSLNGMLASYGGLLKGTARKNIDEQITQTLVFYR